MAVRKTLRRKSHELGDPDDTFVHDLLWELVGARHVYDSATERWTSTGGEWWPKHITRGGAMRAYVMKSRGSVQHLTNDKQGPKLYTINKNRTVTRLEKESFQGGTARLIIPGHTIDINDPDLIVEE